MTNLFKSLLKVQAQIKPLIKDTKGQEGHRTFMYADLTQLLNQAMPLLTQNGLILLQELESQADQQFLKTTLVHAESGESYSVKCPVFFAQNTPRAVGSAMTYARRYSLLGLLALSPGDDDDGEAAQAPRQTQRAPQGSTQAQKPPYANQTPQRTAPQAAQAQRPQPQIQKPIPNFAPKPQTPKGLSKAQIDRVYQIGQKKRWEPEQVDGLSWELFASELESLTASQFAEICDFLDNNGPEAQAMIKGLRG